MSGWSLDRAEEVARAFTVYFHLANLAEEHHRVRVLRSRDAGRRPRRRLTARRRSPRSGGCTAKSGCAGLFAGLVLHPVLTAHPTEARRRAVVTAISRAGEQLDRVDDPRGGAGEQADARRRLLEEIDILWRTAHLRASAVDPLDEVRTTMAVFDETLFLVVPALYRGLDHVLLGDRSGSTAPAAPAFLRLGSWVGGDRDGNPNVTAAITREALSDPVGPRAARPRTGGHADRPHADRRDARPHRRVRALDDALAAASRAHPELVDELAVRSPGEPHRLFVLYAAARLKARRRGDAGRLPASRRVASPTCASCSSRWSQPARTGWPTASCSI